MGLRAPAPVVAPRAPATGAGQEVNIPTITATPATGKADSPPPAASPPAAATTPPGDPVAAPAPTDAKPEEDPRFAPKFAALAKKERVIQEREQKVKAVEGELAAYTKAKAEAKLDPIALLRAHGWEYDTVTQFVLNDSKLTDAQRVKILEDEQAQGKKAAETAAEAAKREHAQRAEASHKEALKAYIDTNADTYELIRAHDAYDLVYDVQASHYQKTFNQEVGSGEILAFDTAANMVEKYLDDKHQKVISSTKKYGQKVSEPGAQPSATTPPVSSPTLTNRMHGTATPSPAAGKMLSEEESKREAAKLLRFT